MTELAVVKDIRDSDPEPPSLDQLHDLEVNVLAQFVFARSSAGMTDGTIQGDVTTLESIRTWLGKPLWEMTPEDADRYFGQSLRGAAMSTRTGKASTLRWFFKLLELRYKPEIYRLTGCVIECPIDEVNSPRGHAETQLRIPPTDAEMQTFFQGWRTELATTRRFGTCARNYTAAKLLAGVGLRINELLMLDLDDVHPELGKFGKLHVRFGKGANGSGPRPRMVPLINETDVLLRWYVEDVRGLFEDAEHWDRPGAPLFPSERRNSDGSCSRASDATLRDAINDAVERHLPNRTGSLTPHVLRHSASNLYLAGMDLVAIQELLGHKWVATTMGYVHGHSRHVDDAWERAAQRAESRLGGSPR